MYRNTYLSTLELTSGATLNDVKHAYRKLARIYHPDINSSPDATQKFIDITEAYEYLVKYFNNYIKNNRNGQADMEKNWDAGHREHARAKAQRYADKQYSNFQKTKYYRGTIVVARSRIYCNLAIALLIIFVSVHGFIIQSQLTAIGNDPPSVVRFIFLLLMGLLFLSVSLLYLLSSFKQHGRKNEKL